MGRSIRSVYTPRLVPVAVLCLMLVGETVATAVSEAWAQVDSTHAAQSGAVAVDSLHAAQGKPVEAKTEVFTNCIKYLGGPGFPDFKGQESWYNTLILGATEGQCVFGAKGLEPISFPMGGVTTITYGQASSRNVGAWVSAGVIVAPIALLGLLHKSRKHNVLVAWKGSDGRDGGVYLEVQPDHVRRLLNSLSYMTGKPIYADPKDWKWLLTQGVQAQLDPGAFPGVQQKVSP